MFTTTVTADLARTIHAERASAHRRAAEQRAARSRGRRQRKPWIPAGIHPLAGFVARLPGYEPAPG